MSQTQFSDKTRCIVYGLQARAVQGMLDFDFMCKRKKPSVAAMVYPFQGAHYSKFYWGTEETLVPVYPSLQQACSKHQDASVLVNFASYRSVYDTCIDAFNHPQLRTLAIIAEGVPERQTREIIARAAEKQVALIGPATVGGIKPGCFRIGNTGGMLDNIVLSKLYRPGSVGYVSKSGGMSNELNNVIAKNSASRRPVVLWCLHFLGWTRVHLTSMRVDSLFILRCSAQVMASARAWPSVATPIPVLGSWTIYSDTRRTTTARF